MSLNRSPENMWANGNAFKSISSINSSKFGHGFPYCNKFKRISHDLLNTEYDRPKLIFIITIHFGIPNYTYVSNFIEIREI